MHGIFNLSLAFVWQSMPLCKHYTFLLKAQHTIIKHNITPACVFAVCQHALACPLHHANIIMGCFQSLYLKFQHAFVTYKHTMYAQILKCSKVTLSSHTCISGCENYHFQKLFLQWDGQLHNKTLLSRCFYFMEEDSHPTAFAAWHNSHHPVTPANNSIDHNT